MSGLLIRSVEVARLDGHGERVDVRCDGGVITEIGARLAHRAGEEVLDGAVAVLPGLHDHHLHLRAMAARASSLDLSGARSPGDVADALQDADRELPPGEWLRAVGLDDTDGETLRRHDLDRIVGGRPVRVQHRSGHLWILNSAAIAAVGLDGEPRPGVERDDGAPTGRCFDIDDLLAERVPGTPPDALAEVGRRLSARGVTGVTDATPSTRVEDLESLAAAHRDGVIPQRLTLTGGPGVAGIGLAGIGLAGRDRPAGVSLGPVKLVVSDHHPPDIEELAAEIAAAHDHDRAAAIHCVSRLASVLGIAAWELAGSRTGDRMEHGAVLPPDLVARLAALGVTVVTQPGFVADRGDRYLAEVEADDLDHLYPCGSLLDAGVPVGGSSDAPFGPDDPWLAMRTAVDRRTGSGHELGSGERITPEQALGLFLTPPEAPGGEPRRIELGTAADLCLLDCSQSRALADLDATHVVATVVDGVIVHRA